MKKQQLTKAAVSLLAASLAFGSAAWAEQTGTGTNTAQTAASSSVKNRFPDVPVSHWAVKYVTKLGLTGIFVGNDKGQFEPESPVTQEQIIVLAIRLAGLEKEALQINTSSYALPFEVSPYAKPYVIEAIEKHLIDPAEETSIASQSKASGKWGTRSASREWVAKLVVRSIGRDEDAKLQESKSTSFTDNTAISSWARGYVNEAASLKIVDGLEDGSFKPKNTVTRAQTAAFLSRAEGYASSHPAAVSIGTVKSVSASAITVTDDQGSEQTFSLVSDTAYYGTKSETTPLQANELKQDNLVYVVHIDDKAYYVEVLKDISDKPVLKDTIEGVFVNVDAENSKLTLLLNGKQVTVELAAALTILDKNGKGSSLASLEEGSRIELKRNGGSQYSSIIIKEVPVNKTAEGILQTVKQSEKKLSVSEKDTGTVEYTLADNVSVTLVTGASADLSQLHTGDSIRYQVTNNQVTSVTVLVPYTEPAESGELIDLKINSSLSYLTIRKNDGSLVSYTLAAVVPVEISGVPFATLNDVVIGDQVKESLDDSKKTVTKITVTSRSIKTSYLNTIINYEAESKTLTAKNVGGELKAYQLSDQTQLGLDDTTLPFSSAVSYLIKGEKVDITVSRETEAVKVRISKSYNGTISSVDASAYNLTLKIGENQYLPFKLTSGTGVELADSVNATVQNLSAGDQVKVLLNATRDSVGQIIVQKTVPYRLISKDTGNRQLKLKDETGNEFTYSVPSNLPVWGTGQNQIAFEDLPLDENISIAYSGRSSEKIVLLNTVRGKITNIDPSAGKLTVTDFNGNTQELNAGSGLKVKTASGTNGTISDLKEDDRVEAIQNGAGQYIVTVAQTLNRPVSSFNPYDQILYVQRPTLQDPASYVFHPKAYVHQGSVTFSPNFLLENDQIRIYVVYGKIIELEKL